LKYPLYLPRARQIDIDTEYNIINSIRQKKAGFIDEHLPVSKRLSSHSTDKNSARSYRETTFPRPIVKSNAINW